MNLSFHCESVNQGQYYQFCEIVIKIKEGDVSKDSNIALTHRKHSMQFMVIIISNYIVSI